MYKPVHRRDVKRPQVRIFECPICGNRTPATKYMGVSKPPHVKTMWCWGCKDERDLVQIE